MAKRAKQSKAKASSEDSPPRQADAHLLQHANASSGDLMKAVAGLTRSSADAAIRRFKKSGKKTKIEKAEIKGGEKAAFDRGAMRSDVVQATYKRAKRASQTSYRDDLDRDAVQYVLRSDERLEEHGLKVGTDDGETPLLWYPPSAGRRLAVMPRKGERLVTERYTSEVEPYVATGTHIDMHLAFRPHAGQAEVAHAWATYAARNIVLRSGRRYGKSQLALALIDQHCSNPDEWGGLERPSVLLVCPTNVQAKDIYFKSGLVDERWKKRFEVRDGDQEVLLPNGGRIAFRGVENAGAREGQGHTMIVIDEAGLIRDLETVYKRTLLPMMMDARGRFFVIGTPKNTGDHYNELFEQGAPGNDRDPEWLSFQGASIQNTYIAEDEIESQRRQMDWLTFQAEILGIPTARTGQIFAFERARHVGPVKYRPDLPLSISWDFNINPMSVLFGQLQPFRDDDTGRRWESFVVLDEMSIPETHTERAALAVTRHKKWGPHRGMVRLYGDATGGARDSTSGTSDWAIIERVFRGHWGRDNVKHCYLDSNPAVIDGDNAVNCVLDPGDGFPLTVIAEGCKGLIRDLETLTLPADGSRKHAKARAERKGLTHMSDAYKYWIARERPIDTILWSQR